MDHLTANVPFGGNGWRCSRCNVWVAPGTNHACMAAIPQAPAFPSHFVQQPNAAELRIAAALERIAEALERKRDPNPEDADEPGDWTQNQGANLNG